MSQLHLTDDDVKQYLQDHPDFFVGKDDLLMQLRIPHNAGPATSLVERQLSIHRERNVELRQRLSDLLENARRNDQLFAKSRRLVLALVEAESWLGVQAALDDSLRNDFGVDSWAMLHFTERQLEAPLITLRSAERQRQILRLFKGHRAVCGQFPGQDIAALLGNQSTDCQSVAAVQIRGQDNNGVLTIASQDPNYYRSSMDTLFLDYIADLLALRLPQIPVV
ncbi:hypothetical protein GCM10011297_27470 [Bacterioplanes sanyensis]|jgi:uncharacterized protein YigA (DUF484 family)|uniref:DUF484 family protein n=1 Tax=Bacterioplanes sanyensis TaxID=1249553 RepID=UPI001679876B|nr:DUF484 family protein [Bacterioplanes sanyensis]GGY53158.1 hypothetical protein GCM10011297_27470 [Bacterioplanes sanyensis]